MGGKVKMASCCVCAFQLKFGNCFLQKAENGMFASAMGFAFLNQIVRRVLKLWDTSRLLIDRVEGD